MTTVTNQLESVGSEANMAPTLEANQPPQVNIKSKQQYEKIKLTIGKLDSDQLEKEKPKNHNVETSRKEKRATLDLAQKPIKVEIEQIGDELVSPGLQSVELVQPSLVIGGGQESGRKTYAPSEKQIVKKQMHVIKGFMPQRNKGLQPTTTLQA